MLSFAFLYFRWGWAGGRGHKRKGAVELTIIVVLILKWN